jgi:hypothetical protein
MKKWVIRKIFLPEIINSFKTWFSSNGVGCGLSFFCRTEQIVLYIVTRFALYKLAFYANIHNFPMQNFIASNGGTIIKTILTRIIISSLHYSYIVRLAFSITFIEHLAV